MPTEAEILDALAADAEAAFDKSRLPSDAFAAARLARVAGRRFQEAKRKTLGVREEAIAQRYGTEPGTDYVQVVISCNRLLEVLNLAETHLIAIGLADEESQQGAADTIHTLRDLTAEARSLASY